jgi:hypothetical protein
MFLQMVLHIGGHLGIFYIWGISAAIGQLWFKRCHLPKHQMKKPNKGLHKVERPKIVSDRNKVSFELLSFIILLSQKFLFENMLKISWYPKQVWTRSVWTLWASHMPSGGCSLATTSGIHLTNLGISIETCLINVERINLESWNQG